MHALTHRFRTFAHEHDDIPAFHAAYLVGTLLVAAIFHLGFFAILIVMHMCLDYVKYRDYFRYDLRTTFKAMMLESLVDIACFMVALTFSVYLSTSYLLVATSGFLRSGLTVLRAFGTILPKIHILESVVLKFANMHAYLYTPHPDIRKPLSKVHRWSLIVIGMCSFMLFVTFLFYFGREQDFYALVVKQLTVLL